MIKWLIKKLIKITSTYNVPVYLNKSSLDLSLKVKYIYNMIKYIYVIINNKTFNFLYMIKNQSEFFFSYYTDKISNFDSLFKFYLSYIY